MKLHKEIIPSPHKYLDSMKKETISQLQDVFARLTTEFINHFFSGAGGKHERDIPVKIVWRDSTGIYLNVYWPRKFNDYDEQSVCIGMYKRVIENLFLAGEPLGQIWNGGFPGKNDKPRAHFQSADGRYDAFLSLISGGYYDGSSDPKIKIRLSINDNDKSPNVLSHVVSYVRERVLPYVW